MTYQEVFHLKTDTRISLYVKPQTRQSDTQTQNPTNYRRQLRTVPVFPMNLLRPTTNYSGGTFIFGNQNQRRLYEHALFEEKWLRLDLQHVGSKPDGTTAVEHAVVVALPRCPVACVEKRFGVE